MSGLLLLDLKKRGHYQCLRDYRAIEIGQEQMLGPDFEEGLLVLTIIWEPSIMIPALSPFAVHDLIEIASYRAKVPLHPIYSVPHPPSNTCPSLPPHHGYQHESTDNHCIQGGLPQQDLIEQSGRQDPLLIGHCWKKGTASQYL